MHHSALITCCLLAAPALAEPVLGGRLLIGDGDAAPHVDTGLRAGARLGRVDVGGELSVGLSGREHRFGGDTAPAVYRVDTFLSVALLAVAGVALVDVDGLRWTLEGGLGPARRLPLDAGDEATAFATLAGTHLLFPVGDLFGGRFALGVGVEARSLDLEAPSLAAGLHLAAVVMD